jgi:hypothetical protein
MLDTHSIDSASSLLNWSNAVYIGGAVLTFAAAAHVLYEKRAVILGRRARESVIAEASVIGAAAISLIGTIFAVHFGNVVSHLKDVDLAAYQEQARVEIAKANASAAQANQRAQEANQKAQDAKDETARTTRANLQLQNDVAKNKTEARNAEAQLGKQNQETSNFAHALAKQQENMAGEVKVAPVLDASQIDALADALRPFAGQAVIFHSTLDTTVLRLGATIRAALAKASLVSTDNEFMMDLGALYKGVSVAVHDPTNVPPLATALVLGLRQAGITAHPVSIPTVPEGRVAIYLGPN